MKLIDANPIIDKLLGRYKADAREYPKQGYNYRVGLSQAIDLLEQATTVDSVPMSVIEDIKAEIEQSRYGLVNDGLDVAIRIIDKHTEGSE